MEEVNKIPLHSDDDWRILQHNLEAIKNLSETEQRQLYYMPNVKGSKSALKQFISRGYSLHVVCEYSDKITISQQNRIFYFNKVLYTKSHDFKGLTYDKKKKKIKTWNCNFNQMTILCEQYLQKIGCDWFTYMPYQLRNLLIKTLMEDILSGKITSQETYVKKWIKISLKSNLHYKLVKKFLCGEYKNINYNSIHALREINQHVDNPNEFLKRIAKGEITNDYMHIFNDTCLDCQVFDKKIRWNWSFNRLNEFHSKSMEDLHILERGEISIEPIEFIGELTFPEGSKCELIMSERQAFNEGREQHNCVYSNYWRHINMKNYFVIRCFSPYRCTVGISMHHQTRLPFIQQIFGAHNSPVPQHIKDMFKEWCKEEEVQTFFLTNYSNHKFKQPTPVEVMAF